MDGNILLKEQNELITYSIYVCTHICVHILFFKNLFYAYTANTMLTPTVAHVLGMDIVGRVNI